MDVKANKLFTLNLEHGVDYGAHPDCCDSHFSAVLTDYDRDGNVQARQIKKRLPGSLSWLPGEVKRGLPEVLLQNKTFKRALFKGTLAIIK